MLSATCRPSLRALQILCLTLLLLGCGGHGREPVISPTTPMSGLDQVEFLIATNRMPEESGSNAFGANRGTRLSYAKFTLSVPPVHRAGKAEMPMAGLDPQRDFIVTGREDLAQKAFLNRAATGPGREVFIYIHGYNTSFPHAVFRQAQLVADSGQPGTAILFSWPSEGALADYTGDRDAANFSRDHLAGLLTDLARNRRITRIHVLGHSMGGWLTAETLRQLALTGRRDVLDRLNVVLASPDIDVDVFASQLATIGPMKSPLTVLVATDDKALHFSEWMSGGRLRVGEMDVNAPATHRFAQRYGIAIVDIAGFEDPGMARHSRYAMVAALDPQVEGYQPGALIETGAFTLRRLGSALVSPFVLIAHAVEG